MIPGLLAWSLLFNYIFLWLYINGEEDMPIVVKSTPPSANRTSNKYKGWKEDWE